MSKQFQNFYIVTTVAMLDVPLPLSPFIKLDAEGVALEPTEYMTIPEYLLTLPTPHTVERFSNDKSLFCKGFGFTKAVIDELCLALPDFGLEENISLWIMNENEVAELLATPEWVEVEVV